MNASVRRVTWIVALGLLALGSCSNQGEGDRCDTKNNDGDCADGLICKRPQGRDIAYCCPPDVYQPTVPQCGAVISIDAGTFEAAASDAAAESASNVVDATDALEEPSAEAAPEAAPPDASTEAAPPDASTDAAPPDASTEAADAADAGSE